MRKIHLFYILVFSLINTQILLSEEYIIKFKSEKSVQNFMQSSEINLRKAIPISFDKRIFTNSSFNPDLYYLINIENSQKNSNLKNNVDIEYYEPNRKFKLEKIDFNDSLFDKQWAFSKIDATNIWNIATGKGIKIGVVDSGIDFTHPDLVNQLYINTAEDVNKNGKFEPWSNTESQNGVYGDLNNIDDDNNGYVDDVIGFDFVDLSTPYLGDWNTPDPICNDDLWHGTAVSSIIAAEQNNKIGLVGLAHGSKIITAKAFNISGESETDDVANAIIYLAIMEADIINMSFGDTYKSHFVKDVIEFANSMGSLIVASSGNSSNAEPHYPSDYNNVISVGSCGKSGNRSGFSSYGVNLSILATGEEIYVCDLNGKYKTAGGTSFSAPFVSAAIALYLENHPKPTPTEMRSQLEFTATKVTDEGWDKYNGSGILNISNLLNYQGLSDYEFLNIDNYEPLTENLDNFVLFFNAIHPLFESMIISIKPANADDYHILIESSRQDKYKSIQLDLSKYYGRNTLSMQIQLNNGQFVRREKVIDLPDTSKALEFEYFNSINAIEDGKSVILISALTTKESDFFVEFHNSIDTNLQYTKYDILSSDRAHFIKVEDLEINGEYSGIAFAVNGLDTVKQEFKFTYDRHNFPQNIYEPKPYSIPRSYLSNFVYDFTESGTDQIITNDFSNLFFGNLELREFKNNQFVLVDSLKDWIIVDYGNINNDNDLDILSSYNALSQVTTLNNINKSPFSDLLFSSNKSNFAWGEALFDFDKDNKDEIIIREDTSYIILKYLSKNTYDTLAKIIPDKIFRDDLIKGMIIKDLDSDGNDEMLIMNFLGYVAIYEYDIQNSKFNLEFLDTTKYAYSTSYMTKIKNGEHYDVIIASAGSNVLFGEINPLNSIWSYRRLSSNSPNNYSLENLLNITGVRQGYDGGLDVSFINGITTGDIDKDNQDELVISAFPNTYIFKYDSGNLKEYWHHPYTISNSAIIWDFDKNGVNEIGISTYDSTRFYELAPFSNISKIPQIFDSYTLTNTSAVIKWSRINQATYYKLFELTYDINGNSQLNLVAKQYADTLLLENLTKDKTYYFLVSAVDTIANTESKLSNIYQLHIHEPIKPVKSKVIDNYRVVISYNGLVKPYLISRDNFITNHILSNQSFEINTILANSDSSYLITYKQPLIQGEYELFCKSFRDFWNNPTEKSVISLEVTEMSYPNEFYLKALVINDLNNFTLEYSDNIDINSASNISKYEIRPYGNILDILPVANDSTKIILTLDDEIKNKNLLGSIYSITARNVFSKSGKKITDGSGNTLSFVLTRSDLNKIFTFPNPIHLSKDEYLHFGNLTSEVTIEIMNLEGRVLKTITDQSRDGGVRWDLKDDNGKILPIGIYLFQIKGKNEEGKNVENELNKFSILP